MPGPQQVGKRCCAVKDRSFQSQTLCATPWTEPGSQLSGQPLHFNRAAPREQTADSPLMREDGMLMSSPGQYPQAAPGVIHVYFLLLLIALVRHDFTG